MRRGRSTGNKPKAQLARLNAIKGVGCIFGNHTNLMPEDMCAEFWEMAGTKRRVA